MSRKHVHNPQSSNQQANDDSHFEWISENVNHTVGQQLEGLANVAGDSASLATNSNVDTGTKAAGLALNAADAGIQTFGLVMGAAENLAESALLPLLGALGMQGMASLPITKQLDPVMGIDIHLVNIPPAVGIPMPHPYIGMLMRSKDFIAAAVASFIPPPPPPPEVEDPNNIQQDEQAALNANKAVTIGHTVATMAVGMIGATVKIGGFIPRTVAGTPTKSIPHFPMGAGWFPGTHASIEKDKGHALLGSLLALADNDPIAGGNAHLHNSCWDIGIPSPHTFRKSKNTDDSTKTKLQLFMPSGVVTPIPMATTILTNPMPAPFNPMAMALKAAKGAFGRLKKLRAKKMKNLSDRMHGTVNNKVKPKGLRNALHKAICTVTGHPVDVASGMFFTDEEDFNLSGPIPLSWERTWYAKSDYKGPLGNGWHHAYDMAIVVDKLQNNVSLRMADGRPLPFAMPQIHTPTFRRSEMLEMRIDENGEYYVWNIKEDLYYYFTKETYDGVQRLRSIANPNGFSIQFKYDRNGYLIEIVDSAHRTLKVENDDEGRIVSIVAPHPDLQNETFEIAKYVYDVHGNMIEQVNAVGDSMHFEYEGYLMVKETWRNGLNWYFKYDGTKIGSRCIHTWGDGNIQNHKLTFYNGLTEVENSLGHVTRYYHKGGLVIKRIDPNKAEHHWRYDEDNQLLSEIDPLGNAYLYSYDERGNQVQIVGPTGATTATEYDEPELPNSPTEAIDINGGKWQWKYDEQGNVIKRINPMGAESLIHFENGLVTSVTDALNNTTSLEYNKQYSIETVRDEQGNVTYYRYDRMGRCIQITNPKGAVQKRRFDLIGRVIEVNDFDGNHIELTYDGIDNLVHYKDSQQEVKYRYKGMWKLTKRTDQRGTTNYFYDTEEQLTKIINENNIPYKFKLDEVGNVIEERSFDQTTKFYERDKAGRVVVMKKSSGKKTTYAYDKASRVTEIAHDNKVAQRFVYNNAGQLLKAMNEDAIVEFKRNKLGLIESETVNEHEITHTYNALGRRTALQSSMGANIRYEHDNFGNLAKLGVQTEQTDWEANYSYDKLGFELERMLPGKVQQTFAYDNIGRLTQQQTLKEKKQKRLRKYTWGMNDRLQAINDSKHGETKFGYTPAGHLEHTQFGDGSEEFRTGDKVGNLFATKERNDRTYGYGGRLEKKGSWHYTYDEEGFLIEKFKSRGGMFSSRSDVWRYEWNAQGILEKVIRPDKHEVTFTYDALGRRLSKKFKNTTTKWLWDGNVPLHEWKENSRGEILSSSSVGDNGVITWVFEEDSFIPTAKLKNDKKFSILADHLGTPTAMYNEEGESVWERSLDSCGRVKDGNHGACPFMYQGQYYDKEIELAYNRFRYYDPEDGRYISVDPIGLESGEYGFYNYVDDPNFWTDNFGLSKTYSKKQIADAKANAKKKAIQRANKLRNQKKHPTVVTVVVHIESGKMYSGVSGTKPTKVHKNLDSNLPKDSKEIWPVNNCGEVDAYNKALADNPGSTISDFTEVSVDVNSGTVKKPCKNCRRWVP